MKSVLLALLTLTALRADAQNTYVDSTFNGTGKNDSLFTGLPNSRSGRFTALALQPDGKIVGALSYGNQISVVRLKTTGQRDSTFGTAGLVQYSASPLGTQEARDVVIQPDGKILVLGQTFISGQRENILLMRLSAAGVPDAGFGSSGVVITNLGGSSSVDYPQRLFLRPSGKIVVAGLVNTQNNDDKQMLVQYTSGGALDNNFGTGGIVKKDYNGGAVSLIDAAMQPDGKIIGVGVRYNGSTAYTMVARYDTAGALDLSFDGDGWQQVSAGTYSTAVKAVGLQSNGSVVLGLYIQAQLDSVYAMRLKADGAIDTAFGKSGVFRYRFGAMAGQWSSLERIMVLPGDSLYLGCSAASAAGFFDYGLLRLTPSGRLDSGWAATGRALADCRADYDMLYAMTLQPDGKVVAAGSSRNGDNTTLSYPSVVRFKYVNRIVVTPPVQGVTAVIAAADALAVYPNPAQGPVTVQGSRDAQLQVLNSLGQTVARPELNAANGFKVVLHNLPAGFYLIRSSDGSMCARFVTTD